MEDLYLDHITMVDPRDNVIENGERALYMDDINSYRLKITNSIIALNQYGFSGTCGDGIATLNSGTGGGVPDPCTPFYSLNWSIQSNVFPKIRSDHNPNSYPTGNTYPDNYSGVGLANYVRCESDTELCEKPLSDFDCINLPCNNAASDGQDIGANISLLSQRIACTESGIGTSCAGLPPVQSPYPGPTAPQIPATLEAENYDNGGEGIAYHDSTTGNNGGVYRFNDVDIQARLTASNGYEVFNASAGEWIEYTVSVASTRTFDIGVRYASGFDNGKIRIDDCGSDPNNNSCTDITGLLTTAKTSTDGTWSTFRVITRRQVQLTAGNHTLRLVMVTNSPDGCGCVVADFDAILFKPSLFDFDNDGRSDMSLFRPSDSNWYLNRSKDGFTAIAWGAGTDVITPSDFDGDGKTDTAIFRPLTGVWWILNSSNGTVTTVGWGLNGDIPVQADYDGDGKSDIALWRPADGTWYIIKSSNGGAVYYPFGANGDRPAVGDYDGDGKYDYAVFSPSSNTWYLQRSTSGYYAEVYGLSTDKITPADYDGDGKTDLALYRPSNGTWYRKNSSNGQYLGYQFGLSADIAVPADYDGDGKADIAVFRPSEGTWYLQRTTEGFIGIKFGSNGDAPCPATYVR